MTILPSALVGTNGPLGSMPTQISVFVNGVLYNNAAPILDARLVQGFHGHDRFHLRMELPPQNTSMLAQMSLWPDDAPVAVQWGRVPDIHTWYGYVNHKEVNSVAESGTNAPQISYVLIGTSAVLDPAVNRKWEMVSPTAMASQIAAENGLRAVTTPGNITLTYETQVGESNHQFLGRIAQKTGYRYWASGGTLYMINPVTAIQGIGSSAIPTFSCNKVPKIIDTCRHFQYRRGQNLPGSVVSNRVVYGLDSTSKTPFSAVSAAPIPTKRTSINTTYATQALSDAKVRADAWSSLSQFWIQAEAQLYGSTSVYPGKIINLVGNALADGASGIWLVTDAEHSIGLSGKAAALDTFVTTATLVRNTNQNLAGGMANGQPVSPEFTSMTLNSNGNWLSANQSVIKLTS